MVNFCIGVGIVWAVFLRSSFIVFSFLTIFLFMHSLVDTDFMDSLTPKNGEGNPIVKKLVIFAFYSVLISGIYTYFQMESIASSVTEITSNKEYMWLSMPIYSKVDLGKDVKYKVIKSSFDTDKNELDKVRCTIRDFVFGIDTRYGHNYHYDEYFETLRKYADNLGGYLKYRKNEKFYVSNSPLLERDIQFNSEEEIKKELARRWDDYEKKMGATFSSQRKKDNKSIVKDVSYIYELKIPENYWNVLINFNNKNLRDAYVSVTNSDNPVEGLLQSFKESQERERYRGYIYWERPFLSIFYLYNLSKQLGM